MFRLSQKLSYLSKDAMNCCRALYTVKSLEIDEYINKREKFKRSYSYHSDAFREKMKTNLTNGTMIFSEDLKYMLHLAGSNEEDVQLVEGMVRNFHELHKDIGFESFDFGPVAMRYFYHIEKPDIALRLFQDPELNGFFSQSRSCHILCDLLYKRSRYQEVIDVFRAVSSKEIQGRPIPRRVVTLAFAACYKLNTPDSCEYCLEQFRQLSDSGHIPLRRAIAFAAALAVKQNRPSAALEIIRTDCHRIDAIVRHIEIEAYAKLERVEDAMTILRGVLQTYDTKTKETLTKDSMNVLKEVISKTANNQLIRDCKMLEKFLFKNGYVGDKTLDDILTSPIDLKYEENNYRKRSSNDRRGLSDLE